jgi:hypothetical protein
MALDHVRSFFMRWDGVKEIWYQPATYNRISGILLRDMFPTGGAWLLLSHGMACAVCGFSAQSWLG